MHSDIKLQNETFFLIFTCCTGSLSSGVWWSAQACHGTGNIYSGAMYAWLVLSPWNSFLIHSNSFLLESGSVSGGLDSIRVVVGHLEVIEKSQVVVWRFKLISSIVDACVSCLLTSHCPPKVCLALLPSG